MRSFLPLAITAACSLGCYHYVPVANSALAPGTIVTVNVSTSGSNRIAPQLGNNVTNLDGSVVRADADGLTLALQSVRRRGELQPSSWAGEPITLATADVADVQEKRLSRSKTVLASTALVAGAVAIVIAIAKGTGGASGNGGGRPVPTP